MYSIESQGLILIFTLDAQQLVFVDMDPLFAHENSFSRYVLIFGYYICYITLLRICQVALFGYFAVIEEKQMQTVKSIELIDSI